MSRVRTDLAPRLDHSRAVPPPPPQHTGEVQQQMARLFKAVNAGGAMLDDLRMRLEPIMPDLPAPCDDVPAAPEEALCPLANELRNFAKIVESNNKLVNLILDRVAL